MRYSYELKVKAVMAYKNGYYLENPGDCKDNSWKGIVREWVNIFEIHGFDGLKHKTLKIRDIDKQRIILEIQNGQSIKGTAHKYGISSSAVGRWNKEYLQNGIEGLKSKWERRRSMPKKINKTNKKIEKCQNSKFTDEEIEYILAENAYLKKLQALIQRKNQAKKR